MYVTTVILRGAIDGPSLPPGVDYTWMSVCGDETTLEFMTQTQEGGQGIAMDIAAGAATLLIDLQQREVSVS